jgi:DNA-binding HxlR family transcriptional regulator
MCELKSGGSPRAKTQAALNLLESKWSVAVIILLASGMHRHARLVDNIPGLSKKVLTSTLRRLESNGIVARRVYAEIPVRVEYSLTPLGWQLTEPLMALYEWAVAHEEELSGKNEDVLPSEQPPRMSALSAA